MENPNSLLEQSSALLNLWATREGKRAKSEYMTSGFAVIWPHPFIYIHAFICYFVSLTSSVSHQGCNGCAVCLWNPSPLFVSLFHASFPAVESLYVALKSIDRMDIVSMLEGQPPQPARQGSRDLSRRRQNEREHLSPGMTNGEFRFPNPTMQPLPYIRFALTLRDLSNKHIASFPKIPWKQRLLPLTSSVLTPSYLLSVMLLCMKAATNIKLLQN